MDPVNVGDLLDGNVVRQPGDSSCFVIFLLESDVLDLILFSTYVAGGDQFVYIA